MSNRKTGLSSGSFSDLSDESDMIVWIIPSPELHPGWPNLSTTSILTNGACTKTISAQPLNLSKKHESTVNIRKNTKHPEPHIKDSSSLIKLPNKTKNNSRLAI
jgi:hypothetical protein